MAGVMLAVGIIAGIAAAMLLTGIVMAVVVPSKFPWSKYLQGATILVNAGTPVASNLFATPARALLQQNTVTLVLVALGALYWFVALADGTAHILQGLDTLNGSIGNLVMMILETLLWAWRIVFESVAPIVNALSLVTSDTASHLVTSILDCTPVDGHQVILTLVGSPVRGLGALMHAWSTWLGSGSDTPDGSFDFNHSLYKLPLNTTEAVVQWVDKPVAALATAASCSCTTLAPALANLAAVVSQPATHEAIFNIVNIPISIVQMFLRLAHPVRFGGLDMTPVSEYLRKAVYYSLVQIDGALELVFTGITNTVVGSGAAGNKHVVRLLDMGGPATAVAHAALTVGSLGMPVVKLVNTVLGSADNSVAEIVDLQPAMAHAGAAVHVAAANIAWLQTLVFDQAVLQPDSDPAQCPVFPVDFTSPRYLQKPKECHCQLQAQSCNLGRCTPQGNCVCPTGTVHLVPGHAHSPCVAACTTSAECNAPGATCRASDNRCVCDKPGTTLRLVYELGGDALGTCTLAAPPVVSDATRPVAHAPEDLDFLYKDGGDLCGPGQELVPRVGGALPCVVRYVGDAVLSAAYAAYELVRVGVMDGEIAIQTAQGRPTAVIEQYVGLPMPRSMQSYGTCDQRRQFPVNDFTYGAHRCLCDVPSYATDGAALMPDGAYDPWCGVPTLEQGLAALDHAAYYVGVGLVMELPIESQGLEALAEIGVAFLQGHVEAARSAIAGALMVFQQVFGAVLHAENLLLRPVNCQLGMPYDGRHAAPAADAADAAALVKAACPAVGAPRVCQSAHAVLAAMVAHDDKPTDAQLLKIGQLASSALHDTQYQACEAFGASFVTPLCQESNYATESGTALDCMCNPELEIRPDGTLACKALNRVPPGTIVQHALGNEENRLRWHAVYDVIGSTRFTRAMASYEWLLYRLDSMGTAMEALVDAFAMPGGDTACNLNTDNKEQYIVNGHTTLSVFYEIDDKTGNIRLKSLMQGLVYDPDNGQLRRDDSAGAPEPFSPCTDGDSPPSPVCPVVAYDNALCGGGAAARTVVHAVSIAFRQIFSSALAVLSVNPSAIDIEFGALMCQAMREEAILAGMVSSALSVVVDVGGDDGVTKQARRALARGLFTMMDALVNIWPVLLNIFTSALNGMVSAGSFNLATVYSMVLMLFDFYAAILCQVLEAFRLLMATLGVDASFLQGVKDVLGIAVQYINGELLEFLIVVGRTVTHFFTFLFAQTPTFSDVIKDMLLVIGVVIRFVANNVFTILKLVFSLLPKVGPIISDLLTKTCEGLFGFLSLIVDGINHVPFVSLDNPFDPVPCVRRRLMAAGVAGAINATRAHHVHFQRYWDSWVARGRGGTDAALWRGTGPCALMMHGEEKPADAVIEGCLRNRAFVGRVRNALGTHDVPMDVLDGLRPAIAYGAGVAQALLTGGDWAGAARRGLPVQSARKIYEVAGESFQRLTLFAGPGAWREHVVPRLWESEDVQDPSGQGVGAKVYRALGAAQRLGHDVAAVQFWNRTDGLVVVPPGDSGVVAAAARRRLATGDTEAAAGAQPASQDDGVFDAANVVFTRLPTTASEEECPSKLVCTRCALLDSLLGSFVRYGKYLATFYGSGGQLQQTFEEFDEFYKGHSHRIKTHPKGDAAPGGNHALKTHLHDGNVPVPHDGRDGGGDDAGDGLQAAAQAHNDYGGFVRAIGRWLVSGDKDERLGFGLGQPLLSRLVGVFGPCDPGKDGGSFGCDAPLSSVGSAVLWGAGVGYAARAVVGGGVVAGLSALVGYLRARYGWVPRCGVALPTCAVRDLQAALQSVLVPCLCEVVPPSLIDAPGCDKANCFLRPIDVPVPNYRDCPVRNPLQYPVSLWRHVSPVTFYGVMAPLFGDINALGLADQLRDVSLGLPLDPEAVVCEVYLGFPVAIAMFALLGPIVVAAGRLAIAQLGLIGATVNMGLVTIDAVSGVVDAESRKEKVLVGARVYLNVVLVVVYLAAVGGGSNHAVGNIEDAQALALAVAVLHLAAVCAVALVDNGEPMRLAFQVAAALSSVGAVLYCISIVVRASSVYVTVGTSIDIMLAVLMALSDYEMLLNDRARDKEARKAAKPAGGNDK